VSRQGWARNIFSLSRAVWGLWLMMYVNDLVLPIFLSLFSCMLGFASIGVFWAVLSLRGFQLFSVVYTLIRLLTPFATGESESTSIFVL
jgi:hypothetical protein